MCHKLLSSPRLRLDSWNTTDAFHPTAPWMPAHAINWQFDLLIQARVGGFRARPGYQLAAIRPDLAADPTSTATSSTTEGWNRFTAADIAAGDPAFWNEDTRVLEPDAIVQCMLNALAGTQRVFLIRDGRRRCGATAWATDVVRDDLGTQIHLEDGVGTVLPMEIPYWCHRRNVYEAGGPNALCAVSVLAGVILHEMMHLCAPDQANDAFQCMAVQNMVAISFQWALAQRYECLAANPCCPKNVDSFFMTSEPDLPAWSGLREPDPFDERACPATVSCPAHPFYGHGCFTWLPAQTLVSS